MPTIHIRDGLFGRYVKATGEVDTFSDFVNNIVKAAVEELEKE